MLWPIILPFKITFYCLTGIIVIVTILAPVVKLKRPQTFWIATLLSLVAFVPSCAVIKHVIDKQRFGLFEHARFHDVNDFRVQRYLPPAAKEITLDKKSQRFRARYRINEAQLSAYIDEVWTKYGDQSVEERGEAPAVSGVDSKYHNLWFGELGWPYLPDVIEYQGPVAENGAGFFIWYSPSEGIAYQHASYW